MYVKTVLNKDDTLAIFSEIQKTIQQNKEIRLNNLIDSIFQDLKSRFQFESMNIFLLDHNYENLIPYKLTNPSLDHKIIDEIYQMPIPMKEEGGIGTYVVQKRMNVYIPELSEDMVLSSWGKKVLELTHMKSNLLFPLFADGAVCGIITFPTYREKLELNEKQIEEIQQYVFYISVAVTSLFFSVELKERNQFIEKKNMQMHEDLKLAKRIQKSLIPANPPQFEGISLASFYKPMDEIGGDFFDFLRTREPHLLGIYISDISGHGVPAALIGSMVKTLIETAGVKRTTPGKFLNFINNKIIGQTSGNFLTAFYGLYNQKTKLFRYSRGAHPYPLLIRDEKIIPLQSQGKILGVMEDLEFEEKEIQLFSKDKILFYTDGLTEALSPEGKEFEAILEEIILRIAFLPISNIISLLYQELIHFKKNIDFDDDICLVGLEIE